MRVRFSLNDSGSGQVRDAFGNGQGVCCPAPGSGAQEIALPLSVQVGVPFLLEFQSSAFAEGALTGFGSCGGQFSFDQLPPGSIVTSCNGYQSALPVAIRTTSWSRVKSIYR